MAYIGVSPSNGVRRKHTYTATASQTTFSGAGAEGVSLSYRDSNYVDVYRNGVKLGDADYTATSGTSIVLGEGAAVSDIIEIIVYDVFSVADTVSKADGGVFDGNVTMAGNLSVSGNLDVTGSLDMSDANLTNVGSIQLDSISGDEDTNTSITFSGSDVITVATGGSTAFTVDASQDVTLAGSLKFADNEKALFGADFDLQIHHDGSNSYIKEVGFGGLIVQASTNVAIQGTNTSNLATFFEGGAVTLYHNNAATLNTTSTGINVTGTVVSDGLTVDGVTTTNGVININSTSYFVGNSSNGFRFNNDTDTQSLLYIKNTGEAVFNDNSLNYDFRVESIGNSAMFFVDGGTNRVGIGNNTPVTHLDVYGNINLRDGYNLTWGGTYGANIPTINATGGAGANIRFYPAGNTSGEVMRITSGGNVGIGTDSPSALLMVEPSARTTNFSASDYTTYADILVKNPTDDSTCATGIAFITDASTFTNGASGIACISGSGDTESSLAFITRPLDAVAAERMRIDSSGNLLVGTTSTPANLTGDVLVVGSGHSGIINTGSLIAPSIVSSGSLEFNLDGVSGTQRHGRITGNGSTSGGTYAGGLDFEYYAYNGTTYQWYTGMRIDSSGNLLVGTGSAVNGATRAGFFNDASANQVVSVYNANNTSGDSVFNTLIGSNCNNTSSFHIVCGVNGVANVFYVYGNGNVVNTNNSYGAISDIKLKENIINASSQWDDIKSLQIRKYSLKSDNLDTPNMLGVIAQELETAGMGGLVFEVPDRDENNNELETTTKNVNYSILYMKAVKALQEAMTRIETLETAKTDLEARITALENAE